MLAVSGKSAEPLIRLENVSKIFNPGSKSEVRAVDDVSFSMQSGEIISLLGESGSGKTTTARLMLKLSQPTSGQIYFHGQDIIPWTKQSESIRYWGQVQAIFQDPFASFNSFYSVENLLANAFRLVKGTFTRKEKVDKMLWSLESVGLNAAELLTKRPHELSGGQRQRIMIARVLIIQPEVLIADEPTSMIDASSRAGILNILLKLRQEMGMSIIFITHDLGMAYYTSDHLYIMNQGKIVERGTPDEVVHHAKNEYTKRLLEDVPTLEKKWAI